LKKEENLFYVMNGTVDNFDNTLLSEREITRKLLNHSADIPYRKFEELDEINNSMMFFTSRIESWKMFSAILSEKTEILHRIQEGIEQMECLEQMVSVTMPEYYI
jgi:hypothetical protein